MFEDLDEWVNAINAFIASRKHEQAGQDKNGNPIYEAKGVPFPDGKPIADLFRSGKEIPPGIRDILAELFNPGDPEYLGCRLVLVDTGALKRNLRAFDTKSGRTAVGERSQYRHAALLKKLIERFKGH